MAKRILLSFFLVVFTFFIPFFFYIINHPQAITINQNKVVYNLPYPGLLPDHPLYKIKMVRDRILEWTTRDNLKKAELYLLFSDKRTAAAQILVKKGKAELAVTTLSKAEKYFLKIPKLIDTSKKQGVSPPPGFVENLKVSNAKHAEVIQEVLKEIPQRETATLDEVVRLNQEITHLLNKL